VSRIWNSYILVWIRFPIFSSLQNIMLSCR
jgi:hypothetical protein